METLNISKEERIVVFLVENKIVLGELLSFDDKSAIIKNPIIVALTPNGLAVSEHPLYLLSKNPEVTVKFNINLIESVRDAEPHEIEMYKQSVEKIKANKLGLEIATNVDSIDKRLKKN